VVSDHYTSGANVGVIPSEPGLARALVAARSRTHALVEDLEAGQLLGPRLAIVNPPLWEIGHLAWFQERWCLRRERSGNLRPSILEHADRLYDSAAVPHDTRWDLPLPTLEITLDYMQRVLERVLEQLHEPGADPQLPYFVELAAQHEEMHCEAFTYTRQTLGYPAPRVEASSAPALRASASGDDDAEIDGGVFELGAAPGSGFVFDNEKWAHPVEVRPFRMARHAVTNQAFAAFVDDDGYVRRGLWSDAGWAWRNAAGALHPVYWVFDHAGWHERRYDRTLPLEPDRALVHVNCFEAEAYCCWAGRRLPTEAEWEYASAVVRGEPGSKREHPWGEAAVEPSLANVYGGPAMPVAVSAYGAGDSAWGCRQMTGNVWEWTASAFLPYPGFVADPYREYSEPWFGTHAVLRGGSFATRGRLLRNTWRNFFTPERRDIFAGFRTCA
jgi:gamma-glutamyl hercynylcysteine S-oxide synthase